MRFSQQAAGNSPVNKFVSSQRNSYVAAWLMKIRFWGLIFRQFVVHISYLFQREALFYYLDCYFKNVCIYYLLSNTHIPIRPPNKYFHFKKSIGNLLDYRNLYFVNLLLLYCIWRKALQKHWQLTIQASLLEHTIPSKLRSFKEYINYITFMLEWGFT